MLRRVRVTIRFIGYNIFRVFFYGERVKLNSQQRNAVRAWAEEVFDQQCSGKLVKKCWIEVLHTQCTATLFFFFFMRSAEVKAVER